MKIAEADLLAQTDSQTDEAEFTVVAFGTSTTARRPGVENVYADLLRKELPKQGLPARVVNQGIPGNQHYRCRRTIRNRRSRLQA